MKIKVNHKSRNFRSFRAEKVKSLFNAEYGYRWSHEAELPVEEENWQIGLIVGPSYGKMCPFMTCMPTGARIGPSWMILPRRALLTK